MGRWQKDKGADFFVAANGAGATYPTGNGGASTTNTDSIFDEASAPAGSGHTSKREGVLGTVHLEANTTCVIANHAGTEIVTVSSAGRTHNEIFNLRFLDGIQATSTGTGDSLITFEYIQ